MLLCSGVEHGHVCHALVDVAGIERIPDGSSAQEILLNICIKKLMVLPVIIYFASVVVGTVCAEFEFHQTLCQ